jgi:hypothetical protein
MTVIGSQDWVITKLSPHRRSLREIPEVALETYNKIDPSLRLPFNARTIATVMNSYIIDEARKAFDGQSGSKFLETNGTTYHLLNGCVLWYKQLGTDGLPSNYPTDTAQVLMQGSFPFLPTRVLLVVGFRLDEAMQKVERVEIQRFNSIGEMQFYIELEKTVSPTRVITMPQGASATKAKTRVAIKRGPEQKELISGDE